MFFVTISIAYFYINVNMFSKKIYVQNVDMFLCIMLLIDGNRIICYNFSYQFTEKENFF